MSKKRSHKYFVDQRHKNKLEANSQGFRTYWSHVIYYTKEPDTRDIREHTNSILWKADHRHLTVDEAIQDHVEWYGKHTKGRYMYYKKPEVPYTIHKVQTDPKYSKRRKDYKKYSNKLLRQAWKQHAEVYQHGQYKKLFGIAWELD